MNDSQNDIIHDNLFILNKQALCVIACAGSGKTTTIINKIKYMINNLHCNPEEFIITTFTNNAVDDIIKRINIPNLNISTFHSFALKELIKYNYIDLTNTPDPIPEYYLIQYLELLNTSTYNHNYKYIFIDEYQDINLYQYNIIKKWYEYCKLLLVVGDDQQNIYTFRNTSIQYILNFCNDFNGQYKYLTINYRCNKGIVELANNIIKFNKNKIDKIMLSAKNEPYIHPKIKICNSENDEFKYILQYIQKIVKNQSIAILCRNNKYLHTFEYLLFQNNITNIILLTIHSAKGLEFDNIIIANCIDGIFPNYNSDIEEERRLFYVATTRTKNKLLITTIHNDINKPSRFIYELYPIDLMNIIYNIFIPKKTLTIIDSLFNMNIEMYYKILNLLNLSTINIKYTVKKIHDEIECTNFNFIKLYTKRQLYELIDTDNYIFLQYFINNIFIRFNKNLFKDDNLVESIKSIKFNTNISLNSSKKDFLFIYKILNTKNKPIFDNQLILKSNLKILSESYDKFYNKNNKSINILNDIFNLSFCYNFIDNKYSTQFNINKYIIIHNLNIIENTIRDIIKDNQFIDYDYPIIIDNYLIGIIDLIIDNKIIIIVNENPTIIDYIKYLIYVEQYNKENSENQINKIQLYNPLQGILLEWLITNSPDIIQAFI